MRAAGHTPKKIPVCVAVRSYVTSDHVALRVDPVGLGQCCARDINGDVLAITQDKPVLVSILTVVETDDGSPRVYAGDPCEGRVGNVDRGEGSCLPQETMEYTVTAEVGANNSRGVDDHRWKRSHGPRDIDQGELASAEQVAVPMKKITADELHSYDVACVANSETSGVDRAGARKIDCRKDAAAQHVAVTAARVTIAPL